MLPCRRTVKGTAVEKVEWMEIRWKNCDGGKLYLWKIMDRFVLSIKYD